MKEERRPADFSTTDDFGFESQREIEKAALKKAYEELDSLIYTITHELKSPAREIELYAEFIEEDNRERLLPQSVKDIRSIRDTCESMMTLVQRMMEYSRAGFKVLEDKKIDMTLLIRQCFEEQVRYYGNEEVRLETADLPGLYGDVFLIRIMFLNIISNSVKFSRGREGAHIWVSSLVTEDGVEYRVRDNGIGFDQQYAGHLFEPFQRLQNEGVYEGNGIGLAIVDRIAKRFGGNVSISGKLNEGCEVRAWFPAKMLYWTPEPDSSAKKTVKVGIISDFSGINSLNEPAKRAAYILATDEINSSGGINGCPVELLFRDDKGDTSLTAEAAKELTEKEQVDVLMGSTLSPSRDIMRKYANKSKTLYLDTQQTEGGVADHYTFCMSAMPEQQMERMLEYLIKKYGKKCYIITSDYNFGILSAEWAKYLMLRLGGEVVGCEYFDDRISDFTPTIDRILNVGSDILVSICVYQNHNRFYEQWHERRMNYIPMASTVIAAVTNDHLKLPPPVLENTYVMASFLEDLNTPTACEFVKKFRGRYDRNSVPYMGMDTETAYSAMYLYKTAAEKAGTTETESVISALESGEIFFDGPGGRVVVRGSDHHTARRMSCFRINGQHKVEEIFRTGAIHSDYIEKMIEYNLGVKGGMKTLGTNAPPTQYNMLLNKLYINNARK